MDDFDELRREAEEARERVKKDIFEFRDILRRMALEAAGNGGKRAEVAVHRAEKRIEETAIRVETRIDRALAILSAVAVGPDKIDTREYDFSDFTSVEVACCFEVEISRSDSFGVTVTGSEKLFDYIVLGKSGNTLKVAVKPFHFNTRPSLKVKITMPALSKLRLSGAARCSVSGFASEDSLDLNLSGASSLDIDIQAGKARIELSGASKLRGRMQLADAEFTLSGASRAELKGCADNVEFNAWGASRLELADFAVKDTTLDLKGASHAAVKVDGTLNLDLSGGSHLTYSGSPTMGSINVSGASTLTQR